MPMNFTKEQEEALRQKFDTENAEWIKGLKGDHAKAHANSAFQEFKEKEWRAQNPMPKIAEPELQDRVQDIGTGRQPG